MNQGAVSEWLGNFEEEKNKYAPKGIYNLDETGLLYNLLPDRNLAYESDRCHGGKRSKQRLTVSLIFNSDGSEKSQSFVHSYRADTLVIKERGSSAPLFVNGSSSSTEK